MTAPRLALCSIAALASFGLLACSDDGATPVSASGGAPVGGGAATAGGTTAGTVAVGGASGSSSGASAGAPSANAGQTGVSGSAGASAGNAGASGSAGSAPGGSGSGGGNWVDPGSEGDGNFEVGPSYTDSPDLTVKPGAPAGFDTSFDLSSADSEIYKGDDFSPPQPFSRKITVFVPSQYKDGAEAPFMVSSDGFYGGLKNVVRNLADDPSPDHRVPPLVIIGIQNGPNTSGSSERSLEYDTVSDRYWRFVTQEVLTAVEAHGPLKARFPHFKLTRDPNGRGGYGCSSGGPAVMGLAWFGDFNRVFSFSGSFTALRPNAEHPAGAWEYPDMIAAAPARPQLRVFLHVGENDNGSNLAEDNNRNWVSANRRMAAALKAKGNHYRFVFAKGGGHCGDPPGPRNQIMPESLIWLWRGYQTP